MSEVGEGIIQGLKEAVAYMDGTAETSDYGTRCVTPIIGDVDVKKIREDLGLTQADFAAEFGLSLYTLRNWEQGKRKPDPASRAYLKVIAYAPEMVKKALEIA